MNEPLTRRVLAVVGGENDGPGYIIYVDANGNIHVERVPGWDPSPWSVLNSAVNILQEAAKIDNSEVRTIFEKAATFALQTEKEAIVKMVNTTARSTK